MLYEILIPSGIGDFSWTWSKLVTTDDQYDIEYCGGIPDRMKAFLKLLPKDRIVSFRSTDKHHTAWENDELICKPYHPGQIKQLPKLRKYSDLQVGKRMFVESNTFLEAGNRIEGWLKDELPLTSFHYKIDGILNKFTRGGYFVVNFSSYGTKKAWGYYDVPDAVKMVEYIVSRTGWLPVFIGGDYDDYTSDIHLEYISKKQRAVSMVGKTPGLIDAVVLIQQSNLYFGACSGLMVVGNILRTPVCAYYPPFEKPPSRHLAGMWHDPKLPYLSLFWDGVKNDKKELKRFLTEVR